MKAGRSALAMLALVWCVAWVAAGLVARVAWELLVLGWGLL